MALALQGAALFAAPGLQPIAEAFCAARLPQPSGLLYGTASNMPPAVASLLLDRVTPMHT